MTADEISLDLEAVDDGGGGTTTDDSGSGVHPPTSRTHYDNYTRSQSQAVAAVPQLQLPPPNPNNVGNKQKHGQKRSVLLVDNADDDRTLADERTAIMDDDDDANEGQLDYEEDEEDGNVNADKQHSPEPQDAPPMFVRF